MNAMSVFLCTEDFPPRLGGISRWSLNTAAALAGHGTAVTVLVKKKGSDVDGMRVIRVPGHDFVRLRWLHFRRAVRALLAESNAPDRIIASTWHVAEGVLGFGIPVTVAALGMEMFRKPSEIIEGGGLIQAILLQLGRRRRRVLEKCDRVVCASRFTADQVRKLAPGASVVSGLCGVDLRTFRPDGRKIPTDHGLQLISVGRLVPRKNFNTVIELLEKMLSMNMDAGLWIVGKGPERKSLIEQARQLKNRIRFFEDVPDDELSELYRSADLFVSPCLSDPETGDVEGFGLTFVEASACGLPVAGIAEGGVTDAVEHGVSGILTSRDTFVREVSELALNPSLLRELGEKGRKRVEAEFDIGKVALNLVL